MFVDTRMRYTGANDWHRAGWHADDGVNHLEGTSPVEGMFGDFAAAKYSASELKAVRCNSVT
jgi:Protein of unknown function (DUF2563)